MTSFYFRLTLLTLSLSLDLKYVLYKMQPIVANSSEDAYYCSSLAVYNVSLKDFGVKKLLAHFSKSLTGLCAHPNHPNLLATATSDQVRQPLAKI